MKIKDFGVEQWMNKYETKARYNLGETCVAPFSLRGLLEVAGVDEEEFTTKLLDTRLTYGAIEGADELKQGIVQLYRTPLAPDNIVTEHGAIGANNLVLNTVVEPGDEVVVVTPIYQQLQSIPQALGAAVKLLPLTKENHYLPDIQELKQLVTPHTKLIILNNPDNPTGALIPEAKLEEVVTVAKSVDAYVLCDEVYRHLTQDDQYSPSIIDLYEKGISTSSFSKVFSLAGLRLGWIATRDRALMTQLLSHRDYATISCGVVDEMIGTLALQNWQKILHHNRLIIRENLQLLTKWVAGQDKISWQRPTAGTTALLYYDAPLASTAFCDQLMAKYQTLLVPGVCFGIENSVRIGYAFESDHLIAGLSRVSAFLAEN